MSTLLELKIAEAMSLIDAANKEEAERENLARQMDELTSKVAQLGVRTTELVSSVREKRVIAESQLAAALTLQAPAVEPPPAVAVEAPVVDIAKKRVGRQKAAAAPIAAAPAAPPAGTKVTSAKGAPAKAAVPVKEAKKGGKAKGADKAAAVAPAATAKGPKKAKAVKTSTEPSEKPRGDERLPTLHERLRIVMAKDAVTIPDAIERLRSRDPKWVPESTDLNAYISLALSTHTKDLFVRVSRGVYRVREDALTPLKGVKSAGPKAHDPHVSNGASSEEVGNVLANPFREVAA